MSWKGVPKKAEYTPLFADEWNTLVDAVDELYAYGPASIGRDLVPTQDARFDVGREDRRFNNVYALFGHFSEQVTVQGKRVLKDGDPISIAYIYQQAKQTITEAIDEAKITPHTESIDYYIQQIKSELEQIKTKLDDVGARVKLLETQAKQDLKDIIAQSLFYVYILAQAKALDVDTLRTEQGDSWFIDTEVETSPKLLVSPSLGKRIATRSWSIMTDATGGDIFIRFANTMKVIGWLPASIRRFAGKDRIIIRGERDEPIFAYWEGVSAGARILIQLAWKEED